MIVYSGTKSRFHSDVMSNDIGNIIYNAFQGATGRRTNRAEINSWTNSLMYMHNVLEDPAIPADAGVAIEYHINPNPAGHGRVPRSSGPRAKRYARQARGGVCRPAGAPAMRGVSSSRNLPAPRSLDGYNLYPCAYLHNYEPDNVITNPFYGQYTKEAPVFLKPDAVKLQAFIKRNIRHGDSNQILYRIDHGRIKPSKSLADSLAGMLKGNQEFVMVDDQKIVYETALALAAQAATGPKQVLIVEGGPGTGKSVVAVNLLVALTNKELVAQYVTRNSAPRLVYEAKLAGTMRRSRISNLFSNY